MTVTDSNNRVSTAKHTLTVNDYTPPVASFTINPTTPTVSQTVTFTDTSTAGSGTINSRSWNFGTDASPATSTAQNPTVSYSSEGSKTVSLTVTDSYSKTSTITQTLQVSPNANPSTGPTPTGGPTPTTPTGPVQVTFAANPTAGGTTTPTGPQTYTTGATQAISATANNGYTFSSWTFTGAIQITSLTTASTSAKINGEGTVTANFIQSSSQKLVFTPAGTGQTLITGQPSSVITVQRQNSNGQAINTGTTTITLDASFGTFYSDAPCTTSISSVTITTGSTASFYYKATATGTPTLTASATNFASVSTTFTINAPASQTTLPSTTSFDGSPWDQGWNYWTNPPWDVATDNYYSSPQSVKTTQSNQGAFSSSPIDTTGAKYITVTFEFMINQYTQPNNLQLRYGVTVANDYNSVAWQNLGVNLGDTSVYSPNTWHQYTITIPNTIPFTTSFRLQFLSQNMSPTAAIWIDNIQITMYK